MRHMTTPVCPLHECELLPTASYFGRRVILKCPHCSHYEVKPHPTPRRAKELVLAEIPLSESDIQIRLIEECRALVGKYPQLEWLHSSLNGAFVPFPAQVAKLKSEGMKSGIFDLLLPVSRTRFFQGDEIHHCGFYLDLKKPGGKLSAEQLRFQAFVRSQGYIAETFDNWRGALKAILAYLESKESTTPPTSGGA